MAYRRLIVLGSTGSIGVNTLDVVEHLNAAPRSESKFEQGDLDPDTIEVVGLAAGRCAKLLIDQARRFGVPAVAIADATAGEDVKQALPGVTVFTGPHAAEELVEASSATDLSAAIVGSAGLAATLAAVRKGMRIGLANKETLVAAGALFTPMVCKHHAQLIPVDSEHSAIFQCIDASVNDTGRSAIKRIVLTASGGPFRTTDKQTMWDATVDQALDHPTWNMGPKITIDSATMMNKALEIIEAHWLFSLPGDQIDVIIHPQSVVHSFVEFVDHSILAQLGPPDMRTPIQYALEYPHRTVGCSRAMDWSTLTTLAFEQPDRDKFGSLDLAYRVIEAGGTAGAVLNAANEAAVAAFLDGRIRFGRIVELSRQALDAIEPHSIDSLEAVLDADRGARAFVNENIER